MTRSHHQHKPNHHLRTAAFAKGMLATLGGGLAFGTLVTQADGPGDELATTFTPITRCRLLDTRPGTDNVGPRATPVGPDETYVVGVTGPVGECNVPDGLAGMAALGECGRRVRRRPRGCLAAALPGRGRHDA